MTNDRAVKWAGMLMVIVSGVLIVVTLYVLASNTWFLLTSESAEGEVISTQNQQDSASNDSSPVPPRYGLVRYRDASGTEHVFSEDIGGESPLYEKGEQVTVLYHLADPENARIRDFMAMYLGPALLLPFAAVFWFIGMLVRATLEKPAPRESD